MKVFDETEESILTLWGCTIASSCGWIPSQTILLITNPGLHNGRGQNICLNNATLVDINPQMTDAERLRDYAEGSTKRDHVNQAFPDDSRLPQSASCVIQLMEKSF